MKHWWWMSATVERIVRSEQFHWWRLALAPAAICPSVDRHCRVLFCNCIGLICHGLQGPCGAKIVEYCGAYYIYLSCSWHTGLCAAQIIIEYCGAYIFICHGFTGNVTEGLWGAHAPRRLPQKSGLRHETCQASPTLAGRKQIEEMIWPVRSAKVDIRRELQGNQGSSRSKSTT
jgi:hypothetical protein